MASTSIRITTGEPVRLDDLCPSCLLPSVWQLGMYTLSNAGVSQVATATVCDSCGHRITARP